MKKLGDNAYPFIFVVSLPYHSVYGKILRVKAEFKRCKPFHGKKIVVFVFKLLRINEHACFDDITSSIHGKNY